MGKRKTIEIETLVDHANEQLKHTVMNSDFRQGICGFIERVLLENDRYAGFRYLTHEEVPKGHLPGIHVDRNGAPFRAGQTDPTRRQYAFKK